MFFQTEECLVLARMLLQAQELLLREQAVPPSGCQHDLVQMTTPYGERSSYYQDGVCLDCGADTVRNRLERQGFTDWAEKEDPHGSES